MIVAEFHNNLWINGCFIVTGLANRGDWFGETWAVLFNFGLCVVVEGAHEQHVIDALCDSHLGHLIWMDEEQTAERLQDLGADSVEFAGNESRPVFLDDIAMIVRCKVHYFVNREHFEATGKVK